MVQQINQLKMKLMKTWMKLLKASAKGKMDKAAKLEQKIIQLEIKMKDL